MTASPKEDLATVRTVRVVDPDDGSVWVLQLDKENPGVNASIIGAFPPKTVQGDWTREHHEWLSAFVQSNWSGGGQRTISQEATDTERYHGVATLETRFPRQMCLLPLTTEVAGPNTDGATMLGDLQQTYGGSIDFWMSYGTKLYKANGATLTDSTKTLAAVPKTNGVSFKGTSGSSRLLYIPLGATGYQTWNPGTSTLSAALTGVGPGSTNVKPLNFVVWDGKIWCLTTEGRVLRNSTGADDNWTEVLRIDTEGDPKRLVRFVDQLGIPALYVLTSRELMILDVAAQAAYVLHSYAPHPHAADAAERWDVTLFFSHGVDVGAYDTSVQRYVGLARDDGVPDDLRGYITSLCEGWNGLYSLVQGEAATLDLTGGFEHDLDIDLLLAPSSAKSAVMVLDRFAAWHTAWASASASSAATNIYVSAANSSYRLYWGFGGKLYFQDLSDDFQNPLFNPTATFAASGRLISPWLDFNKTGMEMILVSIDARHRQTTATETIQIKLQFEDETQPEILIGTLNTVAAEHGTTQFKLNLRETLPDGTPWYEGYSFGRVRYIVDMGRGADNTKTPVLESLSLVYMPRMGTLQSFRFTVQAQAHHHKTFKGRGKKDVRAFMQRLIEAKLVPFNFTGDEWHVVKVAGISGLEETGQATGGYYTVSVVEAFDQ